MGLFDGIKEKVKGQLANVVEWPDMDDDAIFYKWNNSELKKGSRLIIRPAQDAIFLYQGKVEGIFTDEGEYDIESQIIPFLSTLKGWKFGFDTGLRAEVLFINTREFNMNWGTKNALNLPVQGLPGGMPIRAFGMFTAKVGQYDVLIEKVAGVQSSFTVDDVSQRVGAINDQLLMKWILREGKDMFNIQANAYDISQGILEDLNKELGKFGMEATSYQIQSVSYPDSVREMQEKAAGNSMIGDVNQYTQIAFADSLGKEGGNGGGNTASQMAQMQMGMMFGQQMANNMQQQYQQPQYGQQPMYGQAPQYQQPYGQAPQQPQYAQQPQQAAPQMQPQSADGEAAIPKFCPNCGKPTNGMKFCGNCGAKLA
jgi:membrane protease subunit (stomatin/prohibitin family)